MIEAAVPDGSRRAYLWLLAPAVLLMAAFFLYPLIQVLWLSVSEPALGLGHYAELIGNPLIHRVWLNTLRICCWTTLISVLAGYGIAYAMAHVGERHRTGMMFCILLTFWISVLVRSFAWVMLLRPEGVVNQLLLSSGAITTPLRLVRNETGVLIGMAHYMIPIAVFPIYANMRGIPARYVDAARGLGASAMQRFLLVYAPMTKPGVIAAGVLVFISSLGFYVTPSILGGGRVVMIAEYIRVSFEETLRWGYAAMLATTLLALVCLSLAALGRVLDLDKVFGS